MIIKMDFEITIWERSWWGTLGFVATSFVDLTSLTTTTTAIVGAGILNRGVISVEIVFWDDDAWWETWVLTESLFVIHNYLLDLFLIINILF